MFSEHKDIPDKSNFFDNQKCMSMLHEEKIYQCMKRVPRMSFRTVEKDDFIYKVVPKGTILFRGVKVKERSYNKNHIDLGFRFFGELDVALRYAFCGEFFRGEQGKVIVLQTQKDLYLIDMTNRTNLEKIRKKYSTEEIKNDEYSKIVTLKGKSNRSQRLDDFEYMFGADENYPVRYSHYDKDIPIASDISKNLNVDGWCVDKQIKPFNQKELMICNANKCVETLPYEIRFNCIDYKNLLIVKNGILVEKVPEDYFKTDMFSSAYYDTGIIHYPLDKETVKISQSDLWLMEEPYYSRWAN